MLYFKNNMGTKYTKLRSNFFSYVLIISIFVVAGISYSRFMINQDYFVGYEGFCDPSLNSCFVRCEDESCTQKYFYSKVEKYVPILYKECGKDITDCKQANVCASEDKKCSIVYCISEIDGEDECSYFEDSFTDTEEQDFLEDNKVEENI